MGSSPKLGQQVAYEAKQKKLSSAAEELLNAPQPQLLGSIDLNDIQSPPSRPQTWTEKDGTQFTIDEPPPPWEVDPRHGKDSTDARRFLEKFPSNVEFRWINPRLLDSMGWRYWKPVLTSDPNFKLKPEYRATMTDVENNIRKGPGGPILGFMPKSWVESRKRESHKRARDARGKAQDRQMQLSELVSRGDFGRYVKVDGKPQYPSNTQLDGRLARADID